VPTAEKGADFQAIGLTKGGRNSKIHAIVDKFCRPWALILTPGNTADCVMAEECVSLIPGIKELLADKGYDTDAIRAFLKARGIKPVIPGKANRNKKIRHDKKAYKKPQRCRALPLPAQGFHAHRNAIRQARSKLLFGPLPRRNPSLLELPTSA
jgi:transposase